ncbi:MAG: hypothetical protein JWO42_1131, partial [Chloroflexi bacterium]|nr:hypothetical protein [Chloroflexota bacterium]
MGFMWIGTTDGIWRADHHDAPATPVALSGHAITQLVEDRLGTAYASDGRRIWRTEDDWQNITDSRLPDGMPVTVLAASPHPPYPLYAGSIPASLARSEDSGRSWQTLSSFDRTPGRANWTFPGASPQPRVNAIAFDAVDPAIIYATVEVGGIIRSLDGGETWDNCSTGVNLDAHFLAAHPQQAGLIYASMGFGSGQPGGVYRSADRGETWDYCFNDRSPSYTRPIVLDALGQDLLYVTATPQQPPFWALPEGPGAVLWRGNCENDAWHLVFPGATADDNDSSRLITALCIDPQTRGAVYVGTGDFAAALHATGALGRPPGGPFMVGDM